MNTQQQAARDTIQSHGQYAEKCLRNAHAAALARDAALEAMWMAEAQWNAERALRTAQQVTP